MKWSATLLSIMTVAGCHRTAPVVSGPAARYAVGPAWRGDGGAWFYPQERFAGSFTGLSSPLVPPADGRAADGEAFDRSLPLAAVQSLQLPVILRVTDLENGRSILVRAVDRGPSSPGRVIGLDATSRRLLGIDGDETARVRVDIDPVLSQQAAQDAQGGPRPTAAAAPVIEVEERPLGPEPSTPTPTPAAARPEASPAGIDVASALRTQRVIVGAAAETTLWVDAGRFSTRPVAQSVAEAVGGAVTADGAGRRASFSVASGPFATTADADAALMRARAGGITGSRIVVR